MIPIVVVAESSYNVALGSSVTMVCTATFPLHITTNIVWERITDGSKTVIVPYTSKYDGGSALTPSLTIFYAEESDAGVYICYASNVFGVGHGTTELYVVKSEYIFTCMEYCTMLCLLRLRNSTMLTYSCQLLKFVHNEDRRQHGFCCMCVIRVRVH